MMREGYPTMWEKMAQLRGRIAGRMRNIFEKYSLRCGRDTKNAPKEGARLCRFTRETTELFCISRTRTSEFSNKMFGVLKQDVRSLNTMLKVCRSRKARSLSTKILKYQILRIVHVARSESRGLFAELETEFEAVVVGEQRTYVAETRVCHATGNFAGGTEEGEEFVAIEKDADAGSGAHNLGLELHESTEEREGEHLLVGVEGVGTADGHTVEVGFKGVVGIENKGGAAFLETKTGEVFIEFGFEHASCCHATSLGEEVLAFKNGAHTGVAPTAHEFALGDGLAAEDRTEEIVEDVAPCCESCASVARIEVLAEGVEGAA